MHVFCIFVFAPVQRNRACSTWKGALEIRSLLLLLLTTTMAFITVTMALCIVTAACLWIAKPGDCVYKVNSVFFFFCVPQLYLWGSPFLGEIFAYVTVF